ncbi:hypothetical protein R1sor_004023 [Riccia sorocarpa]|uniref:Uncharacterized protein n=1 Tax=Riccia sorocarpa TaxID=122646 RepID=A0ABD3H565_9MARC
MQTVPPPAMDPGFAQAVDVALHRLLDDREKEIARFPATEVDLTSRHGYSSSKQNVFQAVCPHAARPRRSVPIDAAPEQQHEPDFELTQQQQQRAQHAERVRQILDQRAYPRPASSILTVSAPQRTEHTFVFGLELNPIVHRPHSPLNLNDESGRNTPPQQPMDLDPEPTSDSVLASSVNMSQDQHANADTPQLSVHPG